MDLISREAIVEEVKYLKTVIKDCTNTDYYSGYVCALSGVEGMIAQQPTIDAVPVVRCKDCKHWGIGIAVETDYAKCCEYAKYMVGENGYCVYGEKGGSNE